MGRLSIMAAAACMLVQAVAAAETSRLRAAVYSAEKEHAELLERALVNSGRFAIVRGDAAPDVVVLHRGALPGRHVRSGTPRVVVHRLCAAHGPREVLRVRYTGRKHPISEGTAEWFDTSDILDTSRPGRSDSIIAETEDGRPVIWAGGRTVHLALGHDAAGLYETGFLTAVARAAEWAATGRVAGPAAVTYDRAGANPLRVLVVTGGHAYETAFGSLFEGQPDLAPFVYPRDVAFTRDIRPRWDVLVLYDLTLEPGETEKGVLRDFVESGKGLVVLHHAIANHANWPWWFEEVVGGKYFTKPEGDRAISMFKQDQEITIRAAGEHAITRGLAPLHLWEETYKNMWISPLVRTLLETDHPHSDRQVAWISPYEKSRVVYIQSGHDRKSYLHPGYRALVRNAVLWAGGRLGE